MENKMVIKVIRHGQTEWNIAKIMQGHHDSLLSPLGQKQAHCIGNCFSTNPNVNFDLILCSDLGRTRHTLLNILKSLGEEKLASMAERKVKILFSKYVREGAGGVFETKPLSEVHDMLYKIEESEDKNLENGKNEEEMEKRMRRPEGGESTDDIFKRVGRVFRFCGNVSVLEEYPENYQFTQNSCNFTDHNKYSKDTDDTFGWLHTFTSINEVEPLCSQDYPHFTSLPEELQNKVQKVTEIEALNKLDSSRNFKQVMIVSHGGWTREVPNVVESKENGTPC